MTSNRSVNEALDQIESLHGLPVQVEGVLEASNDGAHEGYELLHYPKTERRTEDSRASVGLWLQFGLGSIQPNRPVLSKWLGKRVRVQGIAYGAECTREPHRAGALSDPLFWRAYLEVYSVQRVTSEERKQRGA